MDPTNQDSPLSISSSIIAILTFVVALAAAAYARFTYLRNSDAEYFRVKTSLSWYKTESTWLADLLAALNVRNDGDGESRNGRAEQSFFEKGGQQGQQSTEYQMYAFVMDDLLNLERRLLDVVTDIEARANLGGGRHDWPLVPRSWQSGRSSVAVAWLPVRTKALELVRQREALTTRVQFLQMSMISSRLRTLEATDRRRDRDEMAERMKQLVDLQQEKIQQLEAVIQDRGYYAPGAEPFMAGLRQSIPATMTSSDRRQRPRPQLGDD